LAISVKNIKAMNKFNGKLFTGLKLGALFLAGCAIASLFWIYFLNKSNNIKPSEGRSTFTYHWINPLLECDLGSVISDEKLGVLKSDVQKFINSELKTDSSINQVSIYYRDLDNGPSFGINENTEFLPGSLFKVPVLLTLLYEAQKRPGLLEQKVIYEGGAPEIETHYPPLQKIEKGHTYTIGDLAERMIKYSDNEATLVLANLLGDKISNIYTNLGLEKPVDENFFPMSVKNYSIFFRVLFNASYLNKDMSEAALGLLTTTTFDDGLRAGVPQEISVAHKFGEQISQDNQQFQLHDCGIVYQTDHPYLLCIMSRGGNFNSLAKLISDISGFVYQQRKD